MNPITRDPIFKVIGDTFLLCEGMIHDQLTSKWKRVRPMSPQRGLLYPATFLSDQKLLVAPSFIGSTSGSKPGFRNLGYDS
jgi:hypothetical protein